jgi:eukaryotic-like serine/threonine-protein kinase
MTCPYDVDDVIAGAEPGETYRVLRRLAEGASAFVFEAYDPRHRRRVALKILRQPLSAETMERQGRALKALAHPGVVRVLSFGLTADRYGTPYFVLPLLSGAPLRTVLDDHGAFGLERSVDYACELFHALAYAHARGILHRDVRPENIFLERLAPVVHRVVLLDFGESPERATLVSPLPDRGGHPAYSAPELFYGHEPSVASDLYAAGLVLFEMLTGVHAFGAESRDWAYTHYFSVPPALESLLPVAPPALWTLVTSLLAKPVRLRPSSAEACAQALSAIKEELLVPSPCSTTEDEVDAVLRRIAGPRPDEDTQLDPPPPSLLRRASGPDDTDERPPPFSDVCNSQR